METGEDVSSSKHTNIFCTANIKKLFGSFVLANTRKEAKIRSYDFMYLKKKLFEIQQ